MERLTYSIKDAGHVLSLGTTKIYELLADGQLKSVKIGRKTLVTADSIKALIREPQPDGGE